MGKRKSHSQPNTYPPLTKSTPSKDKEALRKLQEAEKRAKMAEERAEYGDDTNVDEEEEQVQKEMTDDDQRTNGENREEPTATNNQKTPQHNRSTEDNSFTEDMEQMLNHVPQINDTFTKHLIKMLINYEINTEAESAKVEIRKRCKDSDKKFINLIKIMKKMQEVIATLYSENKQSKEINDLLREKIITYEDTQQNIRDTLRTEIHRFSQDLQKNTDEQMRKIVREELDKAPQFPPQMENQSTYAKVAANAAFTKNRDTAVMISPKDDSITADQIRKELTKLPAKTYGISKCTVSRTGKLFVQCATTEQLETLKASIAKQPDISNISNIQKLQPKRQRIILFGAPKTIPYQSKIDTPIPDEIGEYLTKNVLPYIAPYVEDLT